MSDDGPFFCAHCFKELTLPSNSCEFDCPSCGHEIIGDADFLTRDQFAEVVSKAAHEMEAAEADGLIKRSDKPCTP